MSLAGNGRRAAPTHRWPQNRCLSQPIIGRQRFLVVRISDPSPLSTAPCAPSPSSPCLCVLYTIKRCPPRCLQFSDRGTLILEPQSPSSSSTATCVPSSSDGSNQAAAVHPSQRKLSESQLMSPLSLAVHNRRAAPPHCRGLGAHHPHLQLHVLLLETN
jgi:hypothetical protein